MACFEIDFILFGRHVSLGFPLIERRLRLAKSNALFDRLLLELALIEANHGLAFFHFTASGCEPDNLQILHAHRSRQLCGAPGAERAPAVDHDGEFALTRRGGGYVDAVALPVGILFPGEGGSGNGQSYDPQANPDRAGLGHELRH